MADINTNPANIEGANARLTLAREALSSTSSTRG